MQMKRVTKNVHQVFSLSVTSSPSAACCGFSSDLPSPNLLPLWQQPIALDPADLLSLAEAFCTLLVRLITQPRCSMPHATHFGSECVETLATSIYLAV
jgi:hypothetical protein